MIGQMHRESVEAVRDRRTRRTSRRVVGPEHEVINEELRAPAEEIRQRGIPLFGLESIRLVNPHPWQLLTLLGQRVAAPRKILLGLQECQSRRQPLFTCSRHVCRHWSLSFFWHVLRYVSFHPSQLC